MCNCPGIVCIRQLAQGRRRRRHPPVAAARVDEVAMLTMLRRMPHGFARSSRGAISMPTSTRSWPRAWRWPLTTTLRRGCAALVRLGGQASLADQHRQARGIPVVEALLHDGRYALRTLRRDAALTMFAVLIVGVGAEAWAELRAGVGAASPSRSEGCETGVPLGTSQTRTANLALHPLPSCVACCLPEPLSAEAGRW
jgi:hypothetical protein